MSKYGLTGRLQPNPKWKCPDCRQWLAECPCSVMPEWRPTAGQTFEAMFRAQLRPPFRAVLWPVIPLDVHLWNRVPAEEFFDPREVMALAGFGARGLQSAMASLWMGGWLSGEMTRARGRILRLALTIPGSLLVLRLPSSGTETGRQETWGMMRE